MLDIEKIMHVIASEVVETYELHAGMNYDDGPRNWDGWYDGDLRGIIELAVRRTLEAVRDEFADLTD